MPKPRNEHDWLRNNVFYTTCNVGGKVCNMIIDGGSCENVVPQEVIDKLKLIAEDNTNTPGLMKVVKIKVSKRCLVNFSISEYFDDVCNDIVPMDVCHILLGQPWQMIDKLYMMAREIRTPLSRMTTNTPCCP